MERKITKIFVTGSNGFVGKHLVPILSGKGFQLYLLSRKPDLSRKLFQYSNVEIVTGDILEIEKAETLISQCHYFIHMAGEIKSETEMQRTNVEGTENILRLLTKYNQIKLIHLSSCGVYGIRQHPSSAIDESMPCFPSNQYEITKLAADKKVIEYGEKYNIQYTIIRPSNIIGEGDPNKKLLNFCKQIIAGKFIFLSKTAKVNYLYVGHLVDYVAHIIEKPVLKNAIVNMNVSCNIFEFTEVFKKRLFVKHNFITFPIFVRPVFYLFALLGSLIPIIGRYFNLVKYNELINTKTYITINADAILWHNKTLLFEGVEKLIAHYKKEALI